MKPSISGLARRAARRLALAPPVSALRRWRYDRRFKSAEGPTRLFRGIYPDFVSALASAPPSKPIGYDNEATARLLMDERHHVFPSDYPVMFWLIRLIRDGTVLFDLGGNIGGRYLAFRRHLEYPESFAWIVHDVPSVVALGQRVTAEEAAPHLRFTTDFTYLDRADILLASGVLQFLEDWAGFLRSARRLPAHLLINRTPVYERETAVTLHATGTAFCPYHLFNRGEFVAAFARLGYRLVDEWANPGLDCLIPLHPRHAVGSFSGFYFTR